MVYFSFERMRKTCGDNLVAGRDLKLFDHWYLLRPYLFPRYKFKQETQTTNKHSDLISVGMEWLCRVLIMNTYLFV